MQLVKKHQQNLLNGNKEKRLTKIFTIMAFFVIFAAFTKSQKRRFDYVTLSVGYINCHENNPVITRMLNENPRVEAMQE